MENREQYSRLVGYAAGVVAAAPSGPPARTDTARAYRRYYARWQAGERFDECLRGTRAYAAAAVRWSAAEELRTAVVELESAMEDGDEGAAEHAAASVEELIRTLMLSVPGRRGRRARADAAGGAAA